VDSCDGVFHVAAAVDFEERESDSTWRPRRRLADGELLRSLRMFAEAYVVTNTATEILPLEFGEKNGLDVVVVMPWWVVGPFIYLRCPDSIQIAHMKKEILRNTGEGYCLRSLDTRATNSDC
ncbi:Unknown protein, partial [Striga hermonthica]